MLFENEKQTPMKYILIILLFTATVSSTFSQSNIHPATTASLQKNQFMLAKDTSSLKKVLHADLRFIHSNGKIDLKQDLVNAIGDPNILLQVYDFNDIEVRSQKNMALLVGKLHYKSLNNGAKQESNLLVTEVWTKHKKQWQLIARHANKL